MTMYYNYSLLDILMEVLVEITLEGKDPYGRFLLNAMPN